MSARPPTSDRSDGSNEPATLVAEAERRFFARRSNAETLVVSGQQRRQSRSQIWLETTITVGILLLVALSTANSIYIAGWVADMPDLRITAAAAVVIAIALGRIRRLPWPLAMVLGVIVGGLIVMAQITQLETLSGQPLFWDRFTDFGFRFQDWFQQAFSAGLTTDNLPFVFFTDVFVFVRGVPGCLCRRSLAQCLGCDDPARRTAGGQCLLPLRPTVEPVLRILPHRLHAPPHASLPAASDGPMASTRLRLSRLDLALLPRRDHDRHHPAADPLTRDPPSRRVASTG